MSDNRISPLRKAVLNELAKQAAGDSPAPSKRGRPKKTETSTILVTLQEVAPEATEEPKQEDSASEETTKETTETKTDESEGF